MATPPAVAQPLDATLADGVLAGDRAAFAAVYDRYADRLHDLCFTVLRDRDRATVAVRYAFGRLPERLSQLPDRQQLGPALYAMAWDEARKRPRGDSMPAPDEETAGSGDPPTEQGLLRELVFEAELAFSERDRALLCLHLRHGLDVPELAVATGMSRRRVATRLPRLRGRVERDFGALLVARWNRPRCAGLDRLLDGCDGALPPPLTRRLSRHVEACRSCAESHCGSTALALLATAPLVPAPAVLRFLVLNNARLDPPRRPARPWLAARPRLPVGPRPPVGPRLAAGLVALALVIAVASLVMVAWRGGTTSASTVAGAQPATASVVAPAVPSSPAQPGEVVAPPALANPAEPQPDDIIALPALVSAVPALSGDVVALPEQADPAAALPGGVVALPVQANPAPAPAGAAVAPPAQGPPAQGPSAQGPSAQGPSAQGPPAQGPPAQRPPAQAPPAPGPPAADPGAAAPPARSPQPEREPAGSLSVVRQTANPTAIGVRGCGVDRTSVTAVLTGNPALVFLAWKDAAGGGGVIPMQRSGDQWSATLGPFDSPGNVTWQIGAGDVNRVTTRGPAATLSVAACAGR